MSGPQNWLGKEVRAFYAYDRRATHATGKVRRHSVKPQVLIETESGEKIHWREDLCEVIEDSPEPEPVQASEAAGAFSHPPEAQGIWWKSMTANALGMIMGVTRSVGWNEDDFLDKWLADRDAATEELCERIDEHLQELAVEQLRRQLDEKGES